MDKDRFKNYDDDVRQLVLDFERMQRKGDYRYFDIEELETIIDFYLETADGDGLEKSVVYGEDLFPQSSEIKLRRVHLLCFKERYQDAYKLLKQLESLEPDDTDILYALGVVHGALEHPRKAIQYYLKAAEDGYELGIIYSNIADEYVKMEEYSNARNYYRKALRINPDDEHSLYELANCYEDDNLSDKWIHFFSRFVEEHPYSKVGWFCLGEGFVYEQLFEKAIEAYKYALAIDDTYYFAYIQLASCQYAIQQYNDSIATLHDAVNYTDDKADVYYRIANVFKDIDNYDTAIIYYRKALQEDPYFAEAWHSLALSYSMQREYFAAIDATKKAIKIDPESPIYLTTLALIYGEQGDTENADRIFECSIPYYTDFEAGWLAYADYLISLERYKEAIDALTKGLNDCVTTIEFNKRLALCYWKTGQRNMLFNAVRACLMDGLEGEQSLLDFCPPLRRDFDVMCIILSSHDSV